MCAVTLTKLPSFFFSRSVTKTNPRAVFVLAKLIVITRFLISALRINKWQQQTCHYNGPLFSLHSEFLLSKYNNLPEPVVISLPLQILSRCGKVLAFINHSLVILQPRYGGDECIAVRSPLSRIISVFFCSLRL